mmetsp:Transcript_5606/g.11896  ORF Transcript_5606/g.11896 Transcript_5606/m.11896 type:complete len:207 (+) Transcript_5606:1135-1755(+)
MKGHERDPRIAMVVVFLFLCGIHLGIGIGACGSKVLHKGPKGLEIVLPLLDIGTNDQRGAPGREWPFAAGAVSVLVCATVLALGRWRSLCCRRMLLLFLLLLLLRLVLHEPKNLLREDPRCLLRVRNLLLAGHVSDPSFLVGELCPGTKIHADRNASRPFSNRPRNRCNLVVLVVVVVVLIDIDIDIHVYNIAITTIVVVVVAVVS